MKSCGSREISMKRYFYAGVKWLCFNLPDDKDWRTGNLTRVCGPLGSPGGWESLD